MLESNQLAEILDSVLQGRSDNFIEIVRAYSPGLRVFVGTRLYHLDDVDDLVQEVFITAYRKLNTFQQGEDFGAWLRGIARNKLKQYFEKTQRRSEKLQTFREQAAALLEHELQAEADAAEARGEKIQTMMNCISRLPERVRHVVRSQLEGRKAAALASEMDTTPGAIYQLQYRGLQMLRECMEKEASDGI